MLHDYDAQSDNDRDRRHNKRRHRVRASVDGLDIPVRAPCLRGETHAAREGTSGVQHLAHAPASIPTMPQDIWRHSRSSMFSVYMAHVHDGRGAFLASEQGYGPPPGLMKRARLGLLK